MNERDEMRKYYLPEVLKRKLKSLSRPEIRWTGKQ